MKLLFAAGLFVGLVILFGLLLSFPLMLLWNGCLVPALPGLAEVTLFQMWGIFILCSLLFKSHGTSK